MTVDRERLDHAIATTRAHLLSLQGDGAWWEGHLSSSAVSTATATMALALAGDRADRRLVEDGAAWLARTQNTDGGWGDTPDSPSNIAATLLATCALTVAEAHPDALDRAREHLEAMPDADPVAAVRRRYGEDRTFQAPILAACALAGLVPWSDVPSLPFELAALPRSLHRTLRLQVVSYALPALIAVGAAIHRHAPSLNPFSRALRALILGRALGMLPALQPSSGGFLEAAPLTSFVAMTLADVAGREHEVVQSCLRFLRDTVRKDGSWPIDTNLSVWVTTNALSALRASGGVPPGIDDAAREWLLERQQAGVHLFTGASPGGWAWTHLPGGVPDADDTAGAVLQMVAMGEREAAMAGAGWLLGLHNPDGGWPTFCQGWGRLPFDQSSPDITAHAVRALHAIAGRSGPEERHIARLVEVNVRRGAADGQLGKAMADDRFAGIVLKTLAGVAEVGFGYLQATQREDGSWAPLWFGNQHEQAPGQRNPVYGTARVLAAYADCERFDEPPARRGLDYLLRAQTADGGWGGAQGVPSSVEETAVTVSALNRFAGERAVAEALADGVEWLLDRVEDGSWTEPAPIGLYFASLWYTEALYPVAWTVEALGRVRAGLDGAGFPCGGPSSPQQC